MSCAHTVAGAVYTPVEELIDPGPLTLHTGLGQLAVKVWVDPAFTAGGDASDVILQKVLSVPTKTR